LPDTIGWTAYDVGSGGYNQAVAIGSALKNVVGVDLRVLPGRNDVARQIPLREGNVHFSATGIGASYFAQEGVFEFGAADWGPHGPRGGRLRGDRLLRDDLGDGGGNGRAGHSGQHGGGKQHASCCFQHWPPGAHARLGVQRAPDGVLERPVVT
jgi:hypothetical protein